MSFITTHKHLFLNLIEIKNMLNKSHPYLKKEKFTFDVLHKMKP